MNDPLLVRGFEGLRDLLRNRQCFVEWHGALRDTIGERRPFDQLHHQRSDAIRVFETIDRRDMRMVQRGQDFRLTLEADQAVVVRSQRGR